MFKAKMRFQVLVVVAVVLLLASGVLADWSETVWVTGDDGNKVYELEWYIVMMVRQMIEAGNGTEELRALAALHEYWAALKGAPATEDEIFVSVVPSGAVTPIGSTGNLSALPLTGLAASPGGTLFAGGNPGLYSINESTGAATLIGEFGIAGDVTCEGGMAFADDSTLYMAGSNNKLYTVDTATGQASQVGSGSMGYSGVAAMLFIDDTLYGFSNGNRDIISINTSSGAGTWAVDYPANLLGNVTGAALPEPATLGLLLLGGLALLQRRRS